MGSNIAEFAEAVEHVRHLPGQDTLVGEAAKGVLEGLALTDIESVVGGDELGEKLNELPELDESCGGIVAEVPFGKPAQADQSWVVRAQEVEVGSRDHVPPVGL